MPIHYGVPDDEPRQRETVTQTAGTRTGQGGTGASWVRTNSDISQFDRIQPPPTRGARPSPALDPLARMRISTFAKWILLLGVMLFVAWLPTYLHTRIPTGLGPNDNTNTEN